MKYHRLLAVGLLLAGTAFAQSWPVKPVRVIVTFSPHVSYIGSVANVFVVHPSVPARTMAELISWIKAEPNAVNYGSGGIGSMHNDLLAGTIKLAIDTLPQTVPLMKDGKLRAIAVTSPTRASMAPEVPSVLDPRVAPRLSELGVQGRDMTPEEFTAFVADQVKQWYRPVKDSGAKLN